MSGHEYRISEAGADEIPKRDNPVSQSNIERQDAAEGTGSTPVEQERSLSSRKKTRAPLAVALFVVGLAILLGFSWRFLGGKSNTQGPGNRSAPVPVEIAVVAQMDVPIQIESIGNIEAFSKVGVRSQITGTMQATYFTPGQEVRKDALLLKIDSRPEQANLNGEQANLVKALAAVKQALDVVAKDEAVATNSRLLAQRDAQLLESGVIARQDYDNAVSKARADEATVKADQDQVANAQAAVKAQQAAVANAKVQLGYTDIHAPISGKTGDLVVTPGNLIQASDPTPVLTITQTTVSYATFSIPQTSLDEIRSRQGSKEFSVKVFIPNDSKPATGVLSLVDNTVDTTTGTIKLKATFDNSDHRLYPGQFVNVVLTLGIRRDAVTVPSQAVQIGQNQTYVYVVKPDMTAEVRNVKTGPTVGDRTVIEEGVQPGENVVTDGQFQLVPGARVQPKQGSGGRNVTGNNSAADSQYSQGR